MCRCEPPIARSWLRIARVTQAHAYALHGIFHRSSTAAMIVGSTTSFRYQGKPADHAPPRYWESRDHEPTRTAAQRALAPTSAYTNCDTIPSLTLRGTPIFATVCLWQFEVESGVENSKHWASPALSCLSASGGHAELCGHDMDVGVEPVLGEQSVVDAEYVGPGEVDLAARGGSCGRHSAGVLGLGGASGRRSGCRACGVGGVPRQGQTCIRRARGDC